MSRPASSSAVPFPSARLRALSKSKHATSGRPTTFSTWINRRPPRLLLLLLFLSACYIYYMGTSLAGPSFPGGTPKHDDASVDVIERLLVDPSRRGAVRSAFRHAYSAYERDAFGKDNYHPIGRTGHNHSPAGPIGYTIIDVLDALLLLDLREEFARARIWVKELSFDLDDKFHTFEITIRVLGGLLSAHHMSESDNDPIFLQKAIELADRLLPAFNTPSGIPASYVNLHRGEAVFDVDNYNLSSAAEAGTLQLEFKYLSELTGDPKYWTAVEKVMDVIRNQASLDGLVPIMLSPTTGRFVSSEIRLGSRGDSYYEYLLKQYLQTNRTESIYRRMYDKSMHGIKSHLLRRSATQDLLITRELVMTRDVSGKSEMVDRYKQDHLVCFLGGSFLLGATEGRSLNEVDFSDEDAHIGEGLIKSCMDTYNTATGLGPEISYWYTQVEKHIAIEQRKDWYIQSEYDGKCMLRPELVESLFLAYRITRDPMYREWGWKIFQAIELYARIPTGGYATIKDVDSLPVVHEDTMETFFLAETLKYLYLLFSEEELIPLNKFVFNTEAHIFPIFTPTVVLQS